MGQACRAYYEFYKAAMFQRSDIYRPVIVGMMVAALLATWAYRLEAARHIAHKYTSRDIRVGGRADKLIALDKLSAIAGGACSPSHHTEVRGLILFPAFAARAFSASRSQALRQIPS